MAKKTKSKKSAPKKIAKKKPAKAVKKKKIAASSKKALKSKKVKKTLTKKTVKKKESMAKRTTKKTTAKRVTAKKAVAPAKNKAVKKVKTQSKAKTEHAKPVEVKVKIESIKGYSKKDLDHFREIILEKRDEIIEQLQNLKEQMLDPTTGEYINENSPYSLHMAEQGTDAMEREKTFLYAQRENKFLGYLEDALKRIEAGTYGICVECIEEPQHLCDTCPLVPKARLEAVPHSQLCLPMKEKKERR
jgi:RNA polymerase-binding transcription factor DksA